MIFQRALKRELFSAAGVVFTTLFTIVITSMLIRILGLAAGGKVASSDVIILIGFTSLTYLPVLLLLTGYISVLLVVTRAYQDSEMVVWFASGLSLARWIRPVLTFGFPLIALIAALSFVLTPWANRQTSELRERFEKREDIAKVSPGKFIESSSSDRIFFVEQVAGDLSKVKNIFINTVKDGRSSVVVAKEGQIQVDAHGDRFLIMNQGRRYDGLPTEQNFQLMQFEKYGVLLSSESQAAVENKSAKALPLSQLIADPTPYHQGELLWRISLPIMCTVLMLMAIPLGFVNPRVGRSANMIAALLLVAVYINLLNIVQVWVEQGRLTLAMTWWPMHFISLSLVFLMFSWRLNVNSHWHPAVLWSRTKACMRSKRSEKTANPEQADNSAGSQK